MIIVGNSQSGQVTRFEAVRARETSPGIEQSGEPVDQVKSGVESDDVFNLMTLGCMSSQTDQVKASLKDDDVMGALTLGCVSAETDQVKAHLDSDDPMRILSLGCLSSNTDAPVNSVDGYIVKD
jgi:uncharacterized protein YuzB (UPF0349 family)